MQFAELGKLIAHIGKRSEHFERQVNHILLDPTNCGNYHTNNFSKWVVRKPFGWHFHNLWLFTLKKTTTLDFARFPIHNWTWLEWLLQALLIKLWDPVVLDKSC